MWPHPCIDFETEGIYGNPIANPPRPVGVAIRIPGEASKYYSWGHPTGNNSTFADAAERLAQIVGRSEWLAHNSQFECAILERWFGLRPASPTEVHDTMFMLFLHDPYAFTFSLKPSAERLLGLAPEEQDAVRDWILAHVSGANTKKDDPNFWAAFICKAPGDLVGRYATGDTDRTVGIAELLYPRLESAGLLQAYAREQRLAPILSESSRRGVRLDSEKLATDLEQIYLPAQKHAQDYIFSKLGEFDLAKDAELANALDHADMMNGWTLTPTGRRSVSRKNLAPHIKDPDLLTHLSYYGILETCIGTFGRPWLQLAGSDGRLHPQWNQVRGDQGTGGDMSGTRTGRMSCRAPNFQNVPNDFDGVLVPNGFPGIICLRSYLLPESGQVWLKRDFSAQEMRIMAHFAEGKLFEAFKKDPKTDPHDAVQKLIETEAGILLPRKHVKITGFGIMYGRGAPNLSTALGVDVDTGKRTRDAYYAALPEVRILSNATRARGRDGLPIRTWGGRLYFREPSPDRDLSYKLLNYLIQGSAADQTKDSIIVWHDGKRPDDHLLAAVHDEINISAPPDHALSMGWLRESMDMPRFDVPFSSEGFIGLNWAEIKEYPNE
jgi:DNA polymerase-1